VQTECKLITFTAMKTNLVLALDARRAKKDGTYPLILRLSHFGKTIPISLGLSILESDWDESNRKVKKSYSGVSSVTKLNNELQKKKVIAFDIINDLDTQDVLDGYSIKQLKDKIIGTKQSAEFFQFCDHLIADLRKTARFGNANIYITARNVIKRFHKSDILNFREINYSFLKKFETYHLSKGNSWNGLSIYIRTFRAIYNQGITAGHIDKKYTPFTEYKIRHTNTKKRAITEADLKKIAMLSLEESHECFHARNYFLISYMLYGLNFIDIANLKISNIIDKRVQFKRRKTGKEYSIKISEQLQPILEYYLHGKKDNEYIFSIIKRDTAKEQYADARKALVRYNRQLKEIARLCEIETNLTSYVCRHSFATQAVLKDVPILAISEMMGHSKLNTTQTYIKNLPNTILDDFNDTIISL